jgi:Sulfotransferase domain
MRKPDFFMVGAPKCGTTALYRCLEAHPQIFVPERKEIHHFGTDLNSPSYIRSRAEYLSLFAAAGDAQRIGEASVWYLFSKRAATEIKDFCPEASIIIMLRNPVDMIYSLHSQHVYNGTETISDFAEALGAEADRKLGRRLPRDVPATERLFYRAVARYTDQVDRYLKTFGPERVKVIIYDDFKSDPARVCRETFAFLNVNSEVEPKIGVVNPNKQLRSKAAQSVLSRPTGLLGKLARPLTTPELRHRLFATAQGWNTSHVPRSPLPPELQAQLQQEFAPEIERLSALLNRDLTGWSNSA